MNQAKVTRETARHQRGENGAINQSIGDEQVRLAEADLEAARQKMEAAKAKLGAK